MKRRTKPSLLVRRIEVAHALLALVCAPEATTVAFMTGHSSVRMSQMIDTPSAATDALRAEQHDSGSSMSKESLFGMPLSRYTHVTRPSLLVVVEKMVKS